MSLYRRENLKSRLDATSYIQVSDDIMPILQNFVPEAINSQKCHTNMDLILNGY